jgi:hypothetical protein
MKTDADYPHVIRAVGRVTPRWLVAYLPGNRKAMWPRR